MRKTHRMMREVDKFEARQFREVGMSIKDCAHYFDVSIATLMRGLADMRVKFGPEKLPRHRRQYARARIENSPSVSQNPD